MQHRSPPLQTGHGTSGGFRLRQSRFWNQIKADVTTLQVAVPEILETTALGAAFLALVGIGAFATLSEVSEHVIKIHERIDPQPSAQSIYAESYARYRQTYFALLPVFEEAAKVRSN